MREDEDRPQSRGFRDVSRLFSLELGEEVVRELLRGDAEYERQILHEVEVRERMWEAMTSNTTPDLLTCSGESTPVWDPRGWENW